MLQWTGINTVIFYAPQLFISLGTGRRAALLATIVTGVVNHFATYVSLWAADSFGRRILFLEGGVQMLLALVSNPLARSLSGSQVTCKASQWEDIRLVVVTWYFADKSARSCLTSVCPLSYSEMIKPCALIARWALG